MATSIKNSKLFWLGIVLLFALVGYMGLRVGYALDTMSPEGAPDFARGKLEFQLANGKRIPFDVEIADTPKKAAYGLMFRKALPRDAGMIFMQPDDHPTVFWMENTLIPLDMLFVRHDGTIARIAMNAQPLDTSPIRSGVAVRAVVEINGGEAAQLGIKEGDKVLYPGLGDQ